MMKNWINVFTNFPYSKHYYLTHPHKFVSECWTNLQNAWYRATRGWSYQDLWNMNDYLIDIMIDMLRNLAHENHAYPGVEPFETPEKWTSWLYYIAGELEASKEENYERRNEYYDEYTKQFEDENWANRESTEIDKLYFARDKELAAEAKSRRDKALVALATYWDMLWN